MFPSILFEDECVAVLEKGAGMIVNRASTATDETLQDWVEENLEFGVNVPNFRDAKSDFVKRSGIVHRLDKETSGIILVAKTEEAFVALQKQFKQRTVEKEYTLLVHGHVRPDKGIIDVPIARLPWNRKRFGVVPEGRNAVTEYEVVERKKLEDAQEEFDVTLLKAFPKTGRTHQIRVHFKHIHHPVFGDALYAGRKVGRRDRKLLARQFLHASGISFTQPKSGRRVQFQSSLPPELVAITLRFK